MNKKRFEDNAMRSERRADMEEWKDAEEGKEFDVKALMKMLGGKDEC